MHNFYVLCIWDCLLTMAASRTQKKEKLPLPCSFFFSCRIEFCWPRFACAQLCFTCATRVFNCESWHVREGNKNKKYVGVPTVAKIRILHCATIIYLLKECMYSSRAVKWMDMDSRHTVIWVSNEWILEYTAEKYMLKLESLCFMELIYVTWV